MHNPLKCIFPIVFFMGIAASTAQAQDANCNCGEIVKQLQEENARLRGELHQAQTDHMRRSTNAQELEKELSRLRDQAATNSSANPPNVPQTTRKTLPPDVVKDALIQMIQEAKKCGNDGNLVVSFGVDEKGKVVNLNATGGTLKDTPVEKCIFAIIENHHFPKSEEPTHGIKNNFKLK